MSVLLICKRRGCGFEIELEQAAEFFYRDANGPHGFRKWCKACYSEAPSVLRRNAERAATKAANERRAERRAA